MGSELDVKIFLLGPATGVEEGIATPLAGAFHHHFLQSLSDRFLMRQRIPFRIDFYVRQQAGGKWQPTDIEDRNVRELLMGVDQRPLLAPFLLPSFLVSD